MPPNIASPGFAYPASRVTPNTLDWPVIGTDANDDWWREASSIANRSWHLWRTNPYARAIQVTIEEGTLGANGLIPRSIFRNDAGLSVRADDPAQETILADLCAKRGMVEQSLRSAYKGTRFDAAGQSSKRQMTATMLLCCYVAGDGVAIRQWKPSRPGRQYQATCWRVVDPSRVSNPNFGTNSATMFEGFELDDDGVPIAVHVQRRNPYAVQVVDYTWDRIPFFAPDGTRNVVHLKAPGRADEIRGVSFYASFMGLINQLGAVTDAYVVAKRIQACIGIIRCTPDQIAAAAAGKNGSTTTQGAKIYPGMIMDVQAGTTITPLQWNFNGTDHTQFQDSLLQAICAAIGMPMEYVQHRLTKSNMASARAALMQAYRTFHVAQEMVISQVEQPWAESVIAEDMARGRLDLGTDDLDQIFSLRFNRPAKQFPDPVREATAAGLWIGLGKSPSSVFAEQGMDHEQEVLQNGQDRAFMAAHAVPLITGAADPSQGTGGDTNNGVDDTVDGQPATDASGQQADDGQSADATQAKGAA